MDVRGRGFVRNALAACAVAASAGCAPNDDAAEAAGIRLPTPRMGWSTADRARFVVPGEALHARTGPDGSSLVVFRSLPVPGTPHLAKELGAELVNRWSALPETAVYGAEVITVDGRPAVRVEAVAAGDGARWFPTGIGVPVLPPDATSSRPTRRIAVAVPLPAALLVLQWHAPEARADALTEEVSDVLAGTRIEADDGPSSGY